MVHYEIVAEGLAASSRYAKLKASKEALDLLHGLAPFEFRQRYGCNCAAMEGISEIEVNLDDEIIGTAI